MLKVNTQRKPTAIELADKLTIAEVSASWRDITLYLKKHPNQSIVLDLTQIEKMDSAGLAMVAELTANYANLTVQGLEDQQIGQVDEIKKLQSQLQTQKKHIPSRLVRIGMATEAVFINLKDDLIYIGEITAKAVLILRRPQDLRWKDVWKTMEKTGPGALPIVLLLGFLIGLILSFQSAIPLKKFGAVLYVANMVGISLTRELAPLMVAIILAGRTASAFAAEIGTMKVNQEIDALTTMGLKPVVFLVLPRILAVTCMTPILNIFMIVAGLGGSFLFMKGIGYSWGVFANQLSTSVTAGDLWGGMIKTFVFGFLLACIGCIQGLKTRIGATAVGDATTQAVVSCIVMIVVVDGIFAILYYLLGV